EQGGILRFTSQLPLPSFNPNSGEVKLTPLSPLLELASVCVTFGALRAVDGVSLAVAPGERRAIIGPNGVGKTTLFNAIAGETPVSDGTVRYAGEDVTSKRAHQRAARGIGRTFQITNLFGGLSVEENLRLAVLGNDQRKFALFANPADPAAVREAIDVALERTGLAPKRAMPIRAISYGEQRQLELAMALASRPRLLLLDEPAAGLSPAERVRMAEIIRGLPRDLTLVLIEHDMELALGLVDRVTCLHFGQVLVEDTPDGIRGNAKVQEVYLGRRHHA
ncbi:MAG: ABC transporter ATP-binding protein, partial [Burkholderiales bacterium]